MSPDLSRYIITRKRKKYKFAVFAELHNCHEFDEWTVPSGPFTLELGAGSAFFSVELAARHPDRLYVAMDVKADRLQQGARMACERGVENVEFVRADAGVHAAQIPDASVDELWLTFSDPYPKKRHAKHRLTHDRYLTDYARLLRPDGALRIKTDNHDLFHFSLERLVAHQWAINELSFDLHVSHDEQSDARIITTYEARFLAEGLPIYFVAAVSDASR